MGNKYQKELKRKGIVTGSRGGGKDPVLDSALKKIMKDPGYTPSPSHQHWQVKSRKQKNTKDIDPFNNKGRNA